MTDRQKLSGELNKNLRKITTIKKRNRLIRGELFLIDQAIRPKVKPNTRKKIDGLVQEMLDQDNHDWSAMAKKITCHGFRIDGQRWMGPVLKRYWEEKES